MRRLITLDDFIETYTKLKQRGLGFITSKFNTNELERSKTAFNHLEIQSANWWIIPKVKERWNYIITGLDLMEIWVTSNNFLRAKLLKTIQKK